MILIDLNYLLAVVETHSDKFPVPQHMRALVNRIRAAVNECEAAEAGQAAISERDQDV